MSCADMSVSVPMQEEWWHLAPVCQHCTVLKLQWMYSLVPSGLDVLMMHSTPGIHSKSFHSFQGNITRCARSNDWPPLQYDNKSDNCCGNVESIVRDRTYGHSSLLKRGLSIFFHHLFVFGLWLFTYSMRSSRKYEFMLFPSKSYGLPSSQKKKITNSSWYNS